MIAMKRAILEALKNPINGKPTFRIEDSKGELLGRIRSAWTAEEALEQHARWNTAPARPIEAPAHEAQERAGPRPKLLIALAPAKESYSDTDDDDEWLYHVTSRRNAKSILSKGLLPGCEPTFSNWTANSGGRIFLTERGGVCFWQWKVEMHLEHNGARSTKPVLLRLPRTAVIDLLSIDAEGTRDAPARAYLASEAIVQRPLDLSNEPAETPAPRMR